ncbi:hypothetical protein F4779DRAFT_326841 [Xylariaceae sp. FL0662B]|nr:hypothetical protein F4779DRAFT_326841 [Xylariaceae sp. FL0662B]
MSSMFGASAPPEPQATSSRRWEKSPADRLETAMSGLSVTQRPPSLIFPLAHIQPQAARKQSERKAEQVSRPGQRKPRAKDIYRMSDEVAEKLWGKIYPELRPFEWCKPWVVPVPRDVSFNDLVVSNISETQRLVDPRYVHVVFGDLIHPNSGAHIGKTLTVSLVDDSVDQDDPLAQACLWRAWQMIRHWHWDVVTYLMGREDKKDEKKPMKLADHIKQCLENDMRREAEWVNEIQEEIDGCDEFSRQNALENKKAA